MRQLETRGRQSRGTSAWLREAALSRECSGKQSIFLSYAVGSRSSLAPRAAREVNPKLSCPERSLTFNGTLRLRKSTIDVLPFAAGVCILLLQMFALLNCGRNIQRHGGISCIMSCKTWSETGLMRKCGPMPRFVAWGGCFSSASPCIAKKRRSGRVALAGPHTRLVRSSTTQVTVF